MENIGVQELIGEEPTVEPVGRSLSGVAAGIARGVCRHFAAAGYGSLLEVSLKSGRRADVLALGARGEIVIVEIKSGPQDYRTDKKWRDYAEFCDRFFFAVGSDFPQELIPKEVGLMVADRYGAATIREGPSHLLSGARRKAVTLRFARLSALRLQAVLDPSQMPGF